MPRKTPEIRELARRVDRRFNEAAARCRGKRPRTVRLALGPGASMRPRPDAAENGDLPALDVAFVNASMRPRPDAAENPLRHAAAVPLRVASMRPRPDAAENTQRRRATTWRASGRFNEAAARCRGKQISRTETGPLQA